MSKKLAAIVSVCLVVAVFLAYNSDSMKDARAIKALVARNIAARGGFDAWKAVDSLRLSGQMDIGQGMHVPYVMEQKRPGKMCLEFVFDEKTAVQCVNGKTGWKLLPFRGRSRPEIMTERELQGMADTAAIDGLLLSSVERGFKMELLGMDVVAGRKASKLQLTLPGGALRWVYVDEETGLELKLESMRVIGGRQRLVQTYYYDWQDSDGLLIPRRQETQTEGRDDLHFLTVDSVQSNLPLEDSRFEMPVSISGAI